MADDPDATSYRLPTAVPSPTVSASSQHPTPTAPRVAPADGSAETHLLVWRQLCRVLLLMVVIGVAGMAVRVWWFVRTVDAGVDPAVRWSTLGTSVGGCLLILSAAGYVRRRTPPPLAGLRRVEVLLFGTIALALAANQYLLNRSGEFERYAGYGADAVAYRGVGLAGPWAAVIVIYGMFIPNTARRCALVTGGMAAVAVAGTAVAVAGRSPNPEVAWTALFVPSFALAGAAGIAVYGAHKIDTQREAAAEARRLGPYTLSRKLGSGGMGEVYLAEHRLLKRPCAVKLIRPDRADATAVLRFEREVRAATRLTHPAAVQVYDFGRSDDGTFYYVMEYLPGLTLDEVVGRGGRFPVARAVHVLRQVCGALADAHALDLVHRDVKPANVMLCRLGGRPDVAKLLDFGLVSAAVDDLADDRLTRPGGIMGTPAYMSPEQAVGAEAGPPADVYAVGAVAYFLLTGSPPFVGRNALELLHAHSTAPVVPPATMNPSIPADLEAVILACLDKNPTRRFATAAQLDAALACCPAAVGWTEDDANRWWDDHPRSAVDPK